MRYNTADMTRLLLRPKYTIPATLLTTALLFVFLQSDSVYLRTILTSVYLCFFGYFGGQALLPKETRGWQTLCGTVSLLCAFMVVLTPLYFFLSFSRLFVGGLLILMPLVIGCTREEEIDIWEDLRSTLDFASYVPTSSFLGTKLLSILFLWGSAVAFVVLIGKRYSDTLISPWTIVSPQFMAFFFLLTVVLLIILMVMAMDSLSGWLRRKLIKGE